MTESLAPHDGAPAMPDLAAALASIQPDTTLGRSLSALVREAGLSGHPVQQRQRETLPTQVPPAEEAATDAIEMLVSAAATATAMRAVEQDAQDTQPASMLTQEQEEALRASLMGNRSAGIANPSLAANLSDLSTPESVATPAAEPEAPLSPLERMAEMKSAPQNEPEQPAIDIPDFDPSRYLAGGYVPTPTPTAQPSGAAPSDAATEQLGRDTSPAPEGRSTVAMLHELSALRG